MNSKEIIQQGLDFIDSNIKAEITIDDLCNMAGYSYTHYCRLFKQYVGMSPTVYITRRRLLYALYDISNGSHKIDVALTYGFETYAGFYKAFRREFDCAPCAFEKNHKGNKPYRMNILQEEHIMISKTEIQRILVHWGLQEESISNIYNKNTGRQNDNAYFIGNDYVIKFTPNLGSVKNNIHISKAMINAGMPIFDVVKTIYGDDYIQNGELYFIMTKRIKGEQLKCEDVFKNTDIAFQIGENIARLHNALQTFDDRNYSDANIFENVKLNWHAIKKYTQLNNDFIDSFSALYGKLLKQLIHRDVNPSNMIFDNGEFKGFVDFDLSEVNIRIFDICYCATSILSECFSNQNCNKNKWLEILNNLVCGYERVTPLIAEEKQAIPYVIYSIQIICISYFDRFDKYKELAEINIDMLNWMINSGL